MGNYTIIRAGYGVVLMGENLVQFAEAHGFDPVEGFWDRTGLYPGLHFANSSGESEDDPYILACVDSSYRDVSAWGGGEDFLLTTEGTGTPAELRALEDFRAKYAPAEKPSFHVCGYTSP